MEGAKKKGGMRKPKKKCTVRIHDRTFSRPKRSDVMVIYLTVLPKILALLSATNLLRSADLFSALTCFTLLCYMCVVGLGITALELGRKRILFLEEIFSLRYFFACAIVYVGY
jgi:hypothetical protein